MKICRFGNDRLGLVDGSDVLDVTAALDLLPPTQYPLPNYDLLVAHLSELFPVLDQLRLTAQRQPLSGVRLLSPVANPGKIIAAPVNYVKHLEEVLADPTLHHNNHINHIERAGLFLKATSSLVGMSAGVSFNQSERRTDHEVELVVVIGKTCKNVERRDALSCVAGYCVGLDMTIRGPEERSMRKSPDSYTVLGPWLLTTDELPDPGNLKLTLQVNGETRQSSNTSQLILDVEALIEFASRFYTLQPGDLIFTGTPEGVGPVHVGDKVHAFIEGIGELDVEIIEDVKWV